jgi:hypothetical protein
MHQTAQGNKWREEEHDDIKRHEERSTRKRNINVTNKTMIITFH